MFVKNLDVKSPFVMVVLIWTLVDGPSIRRAGECPRGKWESFVNGQVLRILNGGIRGTDPK